MDSRNWHNHDHTFIEFIGLVAVAGVYKFKVRMRTTMKILDVLGTRISKTKLASPLREDFIINMIVNLALMFLPIM